MADLADLAGEIADENLAHTLENRQQYDTESELDCDDCGSEIPAQRRALGGVTRCFECQTNFEAKQKHFK